MTLATNMEIPVQLSLNSKFSILPVHICFHTSCHMLKDLCTVPVWSVQMLSISHALHLTICSQPLLGSSVPTLNIFHTFQQWLFAEDCWKFRTINISGQLQLTICLSLSGFLLVMALSIYPLHQRWRLPFCLPKNHHMFARTPGFIAATLNVSWSLRVLDNRIWMTFIGHHRRQRKIYPKCSSCLTVWPSS